LENQQTIAGQGRKRPQLNVPVSLLYLDPENPRISRFDKELEQVELLQLLYEEFDVEELALSMSENGYFDEEPLVVVPKNLPSDFDLTQDIETQQKKLQELVDNNVLEFTVVEGNRRTATLKLLLNSEDRQRLKISSSFPKPINSIVEDDLRIVPVIMYFEREEISAYLGIRHITGLLKWEAYAKAQFISMRIEAGLKDGKSFSDSVKVVEQSMASRTDTVRKQYISYLIADKVINELGFDAKVIRNKFSLITLLIGSQPIRDFIGLPPIKMIDISKDIIPSNRIKNLTDLFNWTFGNGKDKFPILTDSRLISSRLAPILASSEATQYLLENDNIQDAYELSDGEMDFILKRLRNARKSMQKALTIAFKYKGDEEVKKLVNECIEYTNQLKKSIED